MRQYKAIGLMSGTSLDGIDAALVSTDGENFIRREGFVTIPYAPDFRQRLKSCFQLKPAGRQKAAAVERELTELHAAAVRQLMGSEKADLIGFHGQTVSHAPEEGYTLQLGDGALLAALTGTEVVNDFRTADVKAGGQGAPLVPVYHRALAAGMEKPVAFLNIGGVANVTYVDDDNIIAFDTGPGNALLDDWMLKKTGEAFDKDGRAAKAGHVNGGVLKQLLSHSYFGRKPPKSLDRNAFASEAWQGLSTEDGAATLSSFTVKSIVQSAAFLPKIPKKWIVMGGGRLNLFFMGELQKALGVPVVNCDTLGLNGDAIEAEAFAYLAVRSLRGLPISFPGTTGVAKPLTGGVKHTATRKSA